MATLKPDPLLHRLRNADDHRLKRFRRRLCDAVLARIAASEPSKPIDSDRLKSNIERGLRLLIPAFHIPNHPPYASMIQRAIKVLNEDGGASEGGISEFIKREYEDLPVAHEGFLRHHLRKLCESGVVVSLKHGRYNVANQDDEDNDGNVEDRECHSKRREGIGRVQGRQQGIEDGGREEEAQKKVFGESIAEMQLKDKGDAGEKQEHFGVTEDQCEPETKQMQMASKELDEGGLSEEGILAFVEPKYNQGEVVKNETVKEHIEAEVIKENHHRKEEQSRRIYKQSEPQAQNVKVGTKILGIGLEGGRYDVVVKDGGDGGVEDRECRSERGPGRVQGRQGRNEDGGREEGEQNEGFGKSIVVGRRNEEKQEHFGVTENQCESEMKLMQMIEEQFDFERAGIELDGEGGLNEEAIVAFPKPEYNPGKANTNEMIKEKTEAEVIEENHHKEEVQSGETYEQNEPQAQEVEVIENHCHPQTAKIREFGDVVQGQNFEVGSKILECHGDENSKTQLKGPFAPDGQQQKPPLQGQVKGRRGKPRKPRKESESSWQWVPFVPESPHEEQPPKRRGRPPKARNNVDVSTRALVPEHDQNEQPPRGRGRGRPRKPKQGGGEPSLPSQPHHPQQQPQRRGRGRPLKPKLVAENVEIPEKLEIEQLQ
ncbi:unnamed protein product [Malus baccata var. baccata]